MHLYGAVFFLFLSKKNSTVILAGHETTGNTVSWLLHDLSLHPKEQSLLRDEIPEQRRRAGGKELEAADYDAMPRLNAAIKVRLVFKLQTHVIELCACRKPWDCIPSFTVLFDMLWTMMFCLSLNHSKPPKGLSQSFLSSKDKLSTSLFMVTTGTSNPVPSNILILNFCSLVSVWGPDPNEWNPSRWMDEKRTMRQTGVGMTSNL